jgi:hypothetical protein
VDYHARRRPSHHRIDRADHGHRPGARAVLGDAEVVRVFGMVPFVLRLLAPLQQWSGLT